MKNDEVNNPKHYTSGKIEALEIIEDATKDLDGLEAFSIGSALKYLIRFDIFRFKNFFNNTPL